MATHNKPGIAKMGPVEWEISYIERETYIYRWGFLHGDVNWYNLIVGTSYVWLISGSRGTKDADLMGREIGEDTGKLGDQGGRGAAFSAYNGNSSSTEDEDEGQGQSENGVRGLNVSSASVRPPCARGLLDFRARRYL